MKKQRVPAELALSRLEECICMQDHGGPFVSFDDAPYYTQCGDITVWLCVNGPGVDRMALLSIVGGDYAEFYLSFTTDSVDDESMHTTDVEAVLDIMRKGRPQ